MRNFESELNSRRYNVAIITEGCLPVPPVKGGAIGELIDSLVRQNGNDQLVNLSIFSIYDTEAELIANNKSAKYIYIKANSITKLIDKLVFYIAKKVIKVGRPESYRYIFQRLEYLIKLKNLLSNSKYDITILEGNTTLLLLQKMLGNKSVNEGKKVIHLHNNVSSIYGCFKELNSISAIVGNSQYVIDKFIETFSPSENIETVVLKNCISEKMTGVYEKNIWDQYGIDKCEKVILYVGRLTEQKGVLELIKAYAKIDQDNIVLILIGSPLFGLDIHNNYEEMLRNEVKKCKNKVIFTGYIRNHNLGAFYASADLAVFPSLRDEAAGLTIIEALSYGIPVITTNVGGICEYVNDEIASIVEVDNNFVDNLKLKIEEELSKDYDLLTRSFRSNWITSKYNEEVYYSNFCRIVQELCQ